MGVSVFIFEFVRTEKSGRRRQIDSAPHRLQTIAEAKMLAAAMLKHTTFLGMAADTVVIKSDKGKLMAEVVAEPRTL
jgi:hypothetical protein